MYSLGPQACSGSARPLIFPRKQPYERKHALGLTLPRRSDQPRRRDKSGRCARATKERLHLTLQYVMLLFCSCKHQQSKGRTASRTHREHGYLNCKRFNTQTHTQHCPSQSSTMTFHRNTHTQKASAKSILSQIQAHTQTRIVYTHSK